MLTISLAKKALKISFERLKSGSPSERGIKISLALHALLICLCLGYGCIQNVLHWLRPKKNLYVFSLEALPALPDGDLEAYASETSTQPKAKSTTTQLPAIRFKPPSKVQTKPKTQQTEISQKPKERLSKTSPTANEPKQERATKKLSYEEFLKHNPKIAPQSAPTTKKIVNPSKILQRLGSPYSSAGQGTETDALSAYILQMKLSIDAIWKKPSGLRGGIEAIVEFFIDKDGALSRFKIIKGSHDPLFDKSIEEALGSGLRLAEPPAGKAQTFQLTFKSID